MWNGGDLLEKRPSGQSLMKSSTDDSSTDDSMVYINQADNQPKTTIMSMRTMLATYDIMLSYPEKFVSFSIISNHYRDIEIS